MTHPDEQTMPATVTFALRCWVVLACAKFLGLVLQGAAGLFPQLSLIHISEPTRPY